jgi:hypothetical protein
MAQTDVIESTDSETVAIVEAKVCFLSLLTISITFHAHLTDQNRRIAVARP